MTVIIYSSQCVAGRNIGGFIRETGFMPVESVSIGGKFFSCWKKEDVLLIELDCSLSREAEFLSSAFSQDLVIFASKHKSQSGIPCLTTHATGNWGVNSASFFGGNPFELGFTSAKALRTAFSFLDANSFEGYSVFLECSHHGPTSLVSPSIFVEVGSTEKEWSDEKACSLVAKACLHVAKNWKSTRLDRVCIGFGGGHYCPSFNRHLRKTNDAFSHIAASHSLEEISSEIIKQALRKTLESVDLALIDWKGCKSRQKQILVNALSQAGVKWEKV